MKVWIVREGDGRTAGDIVRRAGDEASAIAEGRVFLGRKRVTRGDLPVKRGDTVRIGPRRAAIEPEILYEDASLVACAKPAGLPTVPDHAGAAHSLVSLVAAKVKGELRVTSRLDRDVSGVVVFARDAAAEEGLRTARAEGRYRRRYVALASGALGERGTWTAPIGRANDPRLRKAHGADAKASTTHWERVASAAEVALLAVDPVTGRTHQIRVHASDAGAALLGDRDYGGPTRIVRPNGTVLALSRIALHCARVVLPGLTCEAAVPPDLAAMWSGDPGAWDEAIRR